MDDEMKNAPEIIVPAEFADKGAFMLTCDPKTLDIYTRILDRDPEVDFTPSAGPRQAGRRTFRRRA